MKTTYKYIAIALILSISSFVYPMEPGLSNQKMLWLGCKTTNKEFDRQKDNRVLEIAAVVTDKWLHPIAETESYVIAQPAWLLDRIESPLKEEYTKSGLLKKSKVSTLSSYKAEAAIIAFIDTHFPDFQQRPQAYMNDFWGTGDIMTNEMPDLSKRISIRAFGFDIRDLIELWEPAWGFVYSEQPTAKGNALEALKEIQYYKRRYFDKNTKNSTP